MPNRFSPGCKCCGCKPDDDHICICGCPNPITKIASVGDDNGTHALTYTGPNWRAECTQSGVPLYGVKGGISLPCALKSSTTLHYAYIFRCETVSGASNWVCQLVAPAQDCFGTWNFSDGGTFGAPSMRSDVVAECDGLAIFTFPTTFQVSGVDTGLPTPGGGGTITVVFDE